MSPTARITCAIAGGDPEAFAAFYEHWFDRCYALARSRTGRDEAFCLDIVQECMVRVLQKMVTLETEAALAVWMARVVETTALDLLRAESRRVRREQTVARGRPEESHSLDPQRTVELAEREHWLEQRLAEAKPTDRVLLQARYGEGETLDRAGALVEITGDAAHGRVRRFVERLQRMAREVFRD